MQGRGTRWPAAGRGRSDRQHQPRGQPGELRGDHEGRQDLQEYTPHQL